jgi:hypothetical protein
MSIQKVNGNLPVSSKIELINEMVMELNGKIAQANFNKNELDQLYSEFGSNYIRKFLRNQSIGNTESTYTGWEHVYAESGYSIWKYTPTDYDYDELNELYFNDALLVNKGEAASEVATNFNKVFLYDGSTYTDNTTEAGTETGTKFNLMEDTSSYLYIGDTNKFYGSKFEFYDIGSNYALKVEYYNGSSWVELNDSGFEFTDNTNDFSGDGSIMWGNAVDADWSTLEVNGSTLYWIRISTLEMPAVVASAYYIIPTTSVIGLLALSSQQILNESWAWCSYNDSVYVTIRNAGNVAYEGSYFIKSASTDDNKKNFFIYNNRISANYAQTGYAPSILGWTINWKGEWNSETQYVADDGIYVTDSSGDNHYYVCLTDVVGTEPPNDEYWMPFNFSVDLDPYAQLSGAVFTGDISANNLSGTNTGDELPTIDSSVTGKILSNDGDVPAWIDVPISSNWEDDAEDTIKPKNSKLINYNIIKDTPDLSAKEDVGVAEGLIEQHEEDFDHTLIATALQSETDPVFSAHQAANITETDIINLSNLSGENTGDQDLSDYVQEALEDGKHYVRKDKNWVEIPLSIVRGTFALTDLVYTFTITTPVVEPTAGATYTNNGITYTVVSYASNTLICTGTGYPEVGGTLTKATGDGDATLTFSAYSVTLTVTHTLGLSAPYSICGISIFDNAGKQIVPDEITGLTNSFIIDLTSFRTLTGTNGYVYLKG